MPSWKVRKVIRRASAYADVIGWQEMWAWRYRRVLRKTLTNYTHAWPNKWSKANPISWKTRDWEMVNSGVVKLHGGLARVSPTRVMFWVLLRSTRNKRRYRFVTNRHYVSGAWTRIVRPFDNWRERNWWKGYNIDRAEVNRLYDDYGHPVVGLGDWNKHHIPPFGPNFRWVQEGNSDIEKMFASKDLELIRNETYHLPYTDHPMKVAVLR